MSDTFPGDREIRLEHATLRGEDAGTETRYTVSLSRPADARWLGALQMAQAEMPQHRRFRLDPSGASLAFSCRSVEGPSGVFEMLLRAESLLEMLGRRLEAATPHDPAPAPFVQPFA
ncbi:MAG TPA: hypothetical protein VH854_02860 [Thermoanaerobaculia bacterium]|jgi:hypothetical protein|nr:hypothetical protein [Thermoanaerobaculia bacterium]